MSVKIEKLTPEQEALIPIYRDKWRKILLSTEQIDRKKSTGIVKTAYSVLGFKEPEILFCNGPNAAMKVIQSRLGRPFREQLQLQWKNSVENPLGRELAHLLTEKFYEVFPPMEQMSNDLIEEVLIKTPIEFNNDSRSFVGWIHPEQWVNYCILYELCVSILNCNYSAKEWELFK